MMDIMLGVLLVSAALGSGVLLAVAAGARADRPQPCALPVRHGARVACRGRAETRRSRR